MRRTALPLTALICSLRESLAQGDFSLNIGPTLSSIKDLCTFNSILTFQQKAFRQISRAILYSRFSNYEPNPRMISGVPDAAFARLFTRIHLSWEGCLFEH